MNGPRRVRPPRLPAFLALALALAAPAAGPTARAQEPVAPDTVPGERFVVEEPITSETFARLKAASKALISRSAAGGKDPVLVFELRPGKARPGGSDFGPSYDLANL